MSTSKKCQLKKKKALQHLSIRIQSHWRLCRKRNVFNVLRMYFFIHNINKIIYKCFPAGNLTEMYKKYLKTRWDRFSEPKVHFFRTRRKIQCWRISDVRVYETFQSWLARIFNIVAAERNFCSLFLSCSSEFHFRSLWTKACSRTCLPAIFKLGTSTHRGQLVARNLNHFFFYVYQFAWQYTQENKKKNFWQCC